MVPLTLKDEQMVQVMETNLVMLMEQGLEILMAL
jgi:hypothetical protein